jgi:hypothetical protein
VILGVENRLEGRNLVAVLRTFVTWGLLGVKKAGAIKSGWGERPPSNGDILIDERLFESVAKIVIQRKKI